MSYVDGYVLAVPKANLEAYKAFEAKAAEVWRDHGALSYTICVGDNVPYGTVTSFPRAVQATDDELVVFGWITYTSREHRNAVFAKVRSDPRLSGSMSDAPFDGKRMIYGGFQSVLEL